MDKCCCCTKSRVHIAETVLSADFEVKAAAEENRPPGLLSSISWGHFILRIVALSTAHSSNTPAPRRNVSWLFNPPIVKPNIFLYFYYFHSVALIYFLYVFQLYLLTHYRWIYRKFNWPRNYNWVRTQYWVRSSLSAKVEFL